MNLGNTLKNSFVASLSIGGSPCSAQERPNVILISLAELCHINLDRKHLDGKSLVPIINNRNDETIHSDDYCWAFKKMWVARKGKWKLFGNSVDASHKDILTKKDSLYLVDLEADPGEMNDLAFSNHALVKELEKQSQEWVKHNKKK